MTIRKPVIFCDFDGTITVNDNIIAIMKHFQPEGWEELVNGVIDQSITIQEGVGGMFRLLPSSSKDEIVQFALNNMKIRDGFQQLLDMCRAENIEFLVTSGGIDFFVYPTLQPFGIAPEQIFCNESNFTGDQIEILWPHACDPDCPSQGCGMCKTAIIRRYPADQYHRILIGDSVTDFAGAQLVDTVFARSHLVDKCRELGMPFYEYHDFHDVIRKLKEIHLVGDKA
ncbi:2-hydroxy-3-keto-5-methylthiopentenyl-1-phosphate phosphatase [Paenibacillus aurantius]|uniref:2-hydroxy-3-keto-5-methylthiopentenyl-1-phosphate phosphatase n=1 Tax=Paenibacillus aurantius TaxID=2918900 RepID=A0AA96LBW3_9BACL|nr:2-hydroxy-3-keto-5-methylthiopentenyl-1-phosphate phosphatase [Paenibacillus aurantius]WNQ09241.1 2-hydroxy-3-keto-5-methylthiopentenyl-1-phosphate phosphatase [Paenibacillus aurantius]